MVISAAEFLDDETVLNHIPWILPEEVPDILKRRDEADLKRMGVLQRRMGQEDDQNEREGNNEQNLYAGV